MLNCTAVNNIYQKSITHIALGVSSLFCFLYAEYPAKADILVAPSIGQITSVSQLSDVQPSFT
jgi:hypothetical protein